MSQTRFFFQYAIRNVWRGRRWSIFAIFSVAAGVATVVALRSLGLAISDSLTANVRASNHGDITLVQGGMGFFSGFGTPVSTDVFSPSKVESVRLWASGRGARISEYISVNRQIAASDESPAALQLELITLLFVDPETYPPTDDLRALEPDGARLSELLLARDDIVISENLAAARSLTIGDTVRISGSEAAFTVRGIVPAETEAGLRDLFAAFFGFAYVDRGQALDLSVNPDPNRISVALPVRTNADGVLRAADELNQLLNDGSGRLRIYSVPRLIEQNQFIADVIGRFVVVMGLGAMLLGGVGIINTMLVMVRRRTEEIAALKTFGVAGWQIAAMFMLEAALLGAIGSALGSLAGVGLSAFTTTYGEAFIQQPLAWKVYPEAIVFGFGLGMVVTAVFGVLPVLTAVQVRPNIILRPNESHVVSLGVAQSLAALAFVVITLGLIAGEIIGPIPALESVTRLSEIDTQPTVSSRWLGIAGVAGTLGLLGVLVGLLWLVVWGLGRLPALGSVELQLALRNLTVRRVRTATTLLALSAGMFALSSITFWGAGVREVLAFTLSDSFGGNVIALPLVGTAQSQLDARVDTLDGLVYSTRWQQYDTRLMSVDGQGVARTFPTITVQDTDNPALTDVSVVAGRALTADDRGKLVVLVRQTDDLAELGIGVGSELTLRVQGMPLTVEVVGLLPDGATDLQAAVLSDILLPPGGPLAGTTPSRQLNVFQIEAGEVDDALRALSAVPLVFAMDITFVDGVVSRFIDQFSALPTLVGLLSLGAAGVIMANTVALATLERRRQIAVLKAIGLETDRVLRVMLLENLLVSLLGGAIGIGLSVLGVSVLSVLGQDNLVLIPSGAVPVALVLVAAALAIGAMATFLSANFALRERVLNVLRYD